MKISINVDLEDFFEDACEEASCGENPGTLKDAIKSEIIRGVKNSISKDCLDSVKEKSKKAIDQAIDNAINLAKETIDNRALEFVNEWLDKKTVISDKWGDPVNELTISELIKQQFDNLLERRVDSNGMFSNGYNGDRTLLQHLTGQKVKTEVENRLSQFNKDIDSQIKAHIESGIKTQVANKFAEMVIQTAKSNNALEKH